MCKVFNFALHAPLPLPKRQKQKQNFTMKFQTRLIANSKIAKQKLVSDEPETMPETFP